MSVNNANLNERILNLENVMTLPEILSIVQYLEGLSQGQNPYIEFYGIGEQLFQYMDIKGFDAVGLSYDIIDKYEQTWDKFSGVVGFGVPHPTMEPEIAFRGDIGLWDDNTYGDDRRSLCNHIAKAIHRDYLS